MMSGDPSPLSDRINTLTGLHPNTERLPQWTQQETRDLISIRADLERDFNVSKRNKTLWEVVASKMREKGYRRSSEQCKCKWKNLVNRYKSKETADPEAGRSCPFFEELHAVFTERAITMQKLLEGEAGTSQSKKKLKRSSGDRSDEEISSDNNEDDEESDEEQQQPPKSKKKKPEKGKPKSGVSSSTGNSIIEMLHEFMEKQQLMDYKWQEMMERRAQERRRFEQEWRQTMEKLERERMVSEQAWREREEQRRMREESRAEKRDALLTALLNKLIQGDF